MLRRTGATHLTDNELILFDALFDGDCSFEMLQRDQIKQSGVLPYTHDLDDDALLALLASLVERGYLRTFTFAYADEGEDQDYYGLTPSGGSLWEQERNPNWDRYIYTKQHTTEDGIIIWSIESTSLDAARGYLTVAQEAQIGAPQEVTLVRKPNHQFLPWKTFPMIFELYGEGSTVNEKVLPLKWWRNIPELLQA